MPARKLILSRYSISACALLATLVCTAIDLWQPAAFRKFLTVWIMLPLDRPFVDWAVTPTALSCWARGVRVYLPNDCSPLFNYSPLWLLLPAPPSGPGWNLFFGFALALLFLASLALLPAPRTRLEFAVRLAATLSGATALLIERGNVDSLLFCMVLLGAWLAARGKAWRLLGYLALTLAALLKFYPAASLVLALRERLSTFWLIVAAALSALLALAAGFHEELAIILRSLPQGGEWALEFTAAALPRFVLLALAPDSPHNGLLQAMKLGLLACALAGGIGLARHCLTVGISKGETAEGTLAVSCAAVVLFCFAAGQNYLYRGVFLIPVLPALFDLARQGGHPRVRIALALTIAATTWVLFVPVWKWIFATGLGLGNYSLGMMALVLVYELAWWWIATVLFALVSLFILRSTVWNAMTRMRHPRRRAALR